MKSIKIRVIMVICKSVHFSLEHKISGTTGSPPKVNIPISRKSIIFFRKIANLVETQFLNIFFGEKTPKELDF